MNEKLMYYLWQQSQLIDKPIVTNDDRELAIVHGGHRNYNSGPDFFCKTSVG